jgi:hypothetical protein
LIYASVRLSARGPTLPTIRAAEAVNMKSIYCWVCIIALLAFGIGVQVGRHHPPSFRVHFVQMFQHNSPGAMDWMRRQCETTTGNSNSNTNISVNNGQVTINSES